MRKAAARVIVLILMLCLALQPAAVCHAAKSDTVRVRAGFAPGYDNFSFAWDWSDLLGDAAAQENVHLAVAGLALSCNAESARAGVEGTLRRMGFDYIKSDYYRSDSDHENDVQQPARTFGSRMIETEEGPRFIICAVVRGTSTVSDAVTDMLSISDGFYQAGANCADDLADYMAVMDGITEDNTILFITGHSLGASTANVLGLLAQERGLVRESANFVYTYASPKYKTGSVETGGDEHMNFRTFSNKDDIVPVVPPNYAKTGVERIFDYSELEPEQKSRFDRVYGYFRNVSYEKDRDLNSHMLHTYLSFYLSELPDREIDLHLTNMEESDLTVGTKTELLVGEKAAFTVTASCSVTVSAEDPAVISVSDGVLTALKSGKTVITVTAEGTSFMKTGEEKIEVTVRRKNPMTVKGRTASVRAGKKTVLKRSKVLTVRNAKGTVTYRKRSGHGKILVNKRTGKVTVAKGLKRGTYKVTVAVRSAGNDIYIPKTVEKIFRIRVR